MDSAMLKPKAPTGGAPDKEGDFSHTMLFQETSVGVSPRPDTAAEVRTAAGLPMGSGTQKGPFTSTQYQKISPNEPQLRAHDSPKSSPRYPDAQQHPQQGAGVPPVNAQTDIRSSMTDSKGVEFRPLISMNSDNLPIVYHTGSLGTVNSDPSIHFAPHGNNFSNMTRKRIDGDSRGQSSENIDTCSPRGQDSESSQTPSSSVTLDVSELSRAVYVRAPLGTFRESLIHMKLREFARGYHGVFGICTFNGVAGWILTTQFLSVLVALMACPDANWGKGSKPFIEVNTPRGALFIYSFCSLALIFLLAFKFGGPRMLAASQKVSHVMTALLICIGFSIEIIIAKDGMDVCNPGRSLSGLTTSLVLFINVVYTQLQLVLFICSMINTLYWPALYKWWFCTHSIRLWHLVKKHKIKLHIPDSVKRAVDAKGPKARSAALDSTTSTGMYLEAHGHSFTQWLFSWGRTCLFWKVRRTTLGPVSVVFYVGQVDEDELPHGFGRWQSDAFHGESIVGYWNHGQPMGPFKSREFGTGSGFMCIRIAWCKAKKGISDFETSFGISDAECCVSGAFFRKFPRVTLHGMDLSQIEGAFPRQLLAPGNNTRGFSKVAARCNIPPKFAHSEELEMASPHRRKRASSEAAAGVLGPLNEENHEYYAAGPTGPPRLMWQASRIPAAVRRKAQGLFRWRSDHQMTSVSREEYFKRSMKLVIDRMDPHLPNFGITNKTELHITADVEQGLHVGGWVPSSELWNVVGPKLGLQQVEPVKGDTEDGGEDNGCAELAEHSSADCATALDGGPAKCCRVKRKVSHSQTRAKGLHQRVGHALQVRENIRHVTLRRPFKNIHHEEKCITEFLNEGPRIRRQTYVQGCKVLTIRVNQSQPRLPDVDAYTRERTNMSMRRDPKGSDILDPSNKLNRPFDWTEGIPELCVEGWRRAEEAGLPEAIIFVHGYNTSDVQSMQVLAQMAAFGNFPSYIKLFLFTWPAGENFMEFFDARENAKNPQLHAAFTDFLRSLRDNGIRQVHLLAHSLGSRMLIMSLHQIEKENLLLKISHLEDLGEGRLELSLSDQKKMHIVSLNFLNPEFFLEDFVATEYSFLRQYCSNISIFCDAHDGALWWSELFSGKQALGRSVFGLYARRHDGGQDDDPQEQDLCTPPLYASSTACFQGYEPEYKHVDTRDWLDVDVIDMTWLGHNVHFLRHSYWSLNREVIEDLRELIVTRKRARQRTSRLDRREGNVWVYRVAPSSLTSIFDSDL